MLYQKNYFKEPSYVISKDDLGQIFFPLRKYSVIPDYNQHLTKQNNQEEATMHEEREK